MRVAVRSRVRTRQLLGGLAGWLAGRQHLFHLGLPSTTVHDRVCCAVHWCVGRASPSCATATL